MWTAWLQDRRMQKFRDVLGRWERGDLSMMEAGAFPRASRSRLGCTFLISTRPSSRPTTQSLRADPA